ncbi:MAG TPA: hypothetical protein PLJ30_09455 [Deltaproteobacteria bacterium]|jgi:AcrR family transcriptional regulator|nr:hypothetical protein [Deltaproteobacteria bacterium]HQQ15305.1 hypothetical protein [Deltaproteobacteria bacterium]HRR21088.1 hypothetical protein [Desulfomonilia bacterium]
MEEELIQAVAQEYVERLILLAHLIDSATEINRSGRSVSREEMWDILDEADASGFAIYTVHSLLSSLKPMDAGPLASPGMRFLHEIVSQDVIPSMRRHVAQAIDAIVREFSDRPGSRDAREKALVNASSVICMELSRLKQLHPGALPHPELVEMWESFYCDEGFAVIDFD